MSDELNEFVEPKKSKFDEDMAKIPQSAIDAFNYVNQRAKAETVEEILEKAKKNARWLGWSEEEIEKIKL